MSCDGEHGRMLVFPSDFGEAGVPPYQPGEGIYTSQMTLLVDSMEVENVQEIIRDTFCALQIPFHEDTYKFKV